MVALVFCTKLYIKLAVALCSFSQFSFPFNFPTANALVLKFGTLPLSCLFSNTLLANFDILFRLKVIHRFVPKKWAKIDMRACFSTLLYFESEIKISRAMFFSSQILLSEETKRMSLARPVFDLIVAHSAENGKKKLKIRIFALNLSEIVSHNPKFVL